MIAQTLSRTVSLTLLLAVMAGLSSCEKPRLRSDAAAEETTESTTATRTVPITPGNPSSATESTPGSDGPVPQESPHDPSIPLPLPPPVVDPEVRVREYLQIQKKLEAQMVGIRSLESDFSRHSATLTELRNQLQLTRSRQAGAGTGGIRIERIRGESTLIDRKGEARELEMKIRAEEPFVAQLTIALAEARRQYEDLQRTAEALLRE